MAGWPIKKNDAAGVTLKFPIYDNDGDLVTTAADLDSEVSEDKGTFTDCTNEATELASGSGVYYLDLTQAEINSDVVATITKTSTSNAKTAVNVFYTSTRNIDDLAYPATSGRSIEVETDGMIHADLKEWLAAAPLALASQRPQVEVDAYDGSLDFNATQKASIQTECDSSLTSYDAVVPADLPTNFGSMVISGAGVVDSDLQLWLASAPLALASQRVQVEVDAYDAGLDFNATQKASVQTEVDASLVAVDLDHFIQVTAGAEEPTDGSYLDQVMHKDAGQTYDPTTDSLEALRDTAPMGSTMVGTDSALLAASAPANFSSMGIEADGHVHGDLKEWLGSAPNALQTGRVDSYVGAFAAAVIAAASFAANAVDANALAADAAIEIADAILSRDIDNVEAAAPVHSLAVAILKAVSRVVDDAGTLKTYETDGASLKLSQTITTAPAADPIDELSVGT